MAITGVKYAPLYHGVPVTDVADLVVAEVSHTVVTWGQNLYVVLCTSGDLYIGPSLNILTKVDYTTLASEPILASFVGDKLTVMEMDPEGRPWQKALIIYVSGHYPPGVGPSPLDQAMLVAIPLVTLVMGTAVAVLPSFVLSASQALSGNGGDARNQYIEVLGYAGLRSPLGYGAGTSMGAWKAPLRSLGAASVPTFTDMVPSINQGAWLYDSPNLSLPGSALRVGSLGLPDPWADQLGFVRDSTPGAPYGFKLVTLTGRLVPEGESLGSPSVFVQEANSVVPVVRLGYGTGEQYGRVPLTLLNHKHRNTPIMLVLGWDLAGVSLPATDLGACVIGTEYGEASYVMATHTVIHGFGTGITAAADIPVTGRLLAIACGFKGSLLDPARVNGATTWLASAGIVVAINNKLYYGATFSALRDNILSSTAVHTFVGGAYSGTEADQCEIIFIGPMPNNSGTLSPGWWVVRTYHTDYQIYGIDIQVVFLHSADGITWTEKYSAKYTDEDVFPEPELATDCRYPTRSSQYVTLAATPRMLFARVDSGVVNAHPSTWGGSLLIEPESRISRTYMHKDTDTLDGFTPYHDLFGTANYNPYRGITQYPCVSSVTYPYGATQIRKTDSNGTVSTVFDSAQFGIAGMQSSRAHRTRAWNTSLGALDVPSVGLVDLGLTTNSLEFAFPLVDDGDVYWVGAFDTGASPSLQLGELYPGYGYTKPVPVVYKHQIIPQDTSLNRPLVTMGDTYTDPMLGTICLHSGPFGGMRTHISFSENTLQSAYSFRAFHALSGGSGLGRVNALGFSAVGLYSEPNSPRDAHGIPDIFLTDTLGNVRKLTYTMASHKYSFPPDMAPTDPTTLLMEFGVTAATSVFSIANFTELTGYPDGLGGGGNIELMDSYFDGKAIVVGGVNAQYLKSTTLGVITSSPHHMVDLCLDLGPGGELLATAPLLNITLTATGHRLWIEYDADNELLYTRIRNADSIANGGAVDYWEIMSGLTIPTVDVKPTNIRVMFSGSNVTVFINGENTNSIVQTGDQWIASGLSGSIAHVTTVGAYTPADVPVAGDLYFEWLRITPLLVDHVAPLIAAYTYPVLQPHAGGDGSYAGPSDLQFPIVSASLVGSLNLRVAKVGTGWVALSTGDGLSGFPTGPTAIWTASSVLGPWTFLASGGQQADTEALGSPHKGLTDPNRGDSIKFIPDALGPNTLLSQIVFPDE